MRRRNLLIFLSLFCLLVFILTPSASMGIEALDVAILPPVNTDKYGDKDTIQKMQAKISRHFRYPYYERIESGKIKDALAAIDPALQGKKAYDQEVLQSISQKLPADIVVVVELAKARSRLYEPMMMDGDTYEQTDVVLNCYTYSAKDGKYDKATVSAYKLDVASVASGLDAVLPELTGELLKKIPYKTINKQE